MPDKYNVIGISSTLVYIVNINLLKPKLMLILFKNFALIIEERTTPIEKKLK